MSTCYTLQYEHDESSGREMHLYRDAKDPGFVLLELTGIPFEIDGPLHLETTYPSSLLLTLDKEQAQCHGLAGKNIEVHGEPARITVKIPEKWAQKLGLVGLLQKTDNKALLENP
jgi:hypothetical protein